jgi:isoquinoline 1-oxidoreductase subunit alpha
MSTSLTINGKAVAVNAEPDTPLLWVLRGELAMNGTKFGCGMALCGACTVHVDGAPTRSCVTPIAALAGKAITTIEGLSGPVPEAVQKAWDEADVVQCGYCQSGQVMAACALLRDKPKPTEAEVDGAMAGNLCRCGTYPRIRVAIQVASRNLAGTG